MYNSQELANRIHTILKMKNLAVGNMLVDCGLSKNALSSMQSGGSMPKSDNLAKIADFLNCSVDYLLGRTDNPNIGGTEAYIGGDNNGIQALKNGTVIISNNVEQEIIMLLSKLPPADKHRAVADIIDLISEKYLLIIKD